MCAHLKTHQVAKPQHLWKQCKNNITSQEKKRALKITLILIAYARCNLLSDIKQYKSHKSLKIDF